MSNEKLEATGIVDWQVRDKETGGTQFDRFDLFDKVINLRLICGATAKEQSDFVLRSDYETYAGSYAGAKVANSSVPMLTDGKKAVIRKCTLKPSIKVQYKQVSGNTAIELDIFIQNFYVLSSDGSTLMQFSNSRFPLKSVEVQMGYFGQWASKYAKNPNHVPAPEQYIAMEAPEGVQTLFCNVEYVQTDKLPPDYTLHIHGYVGSCYNEPVKDMLDKVSENKESKEDYGVKLYTADKDDFKFKSFQHYLFNNVTRRFLRRTTVSTDKKVQEKLLSSVKTDKHGLMDYSTAKQYGVRVFVSEGVQKHYKFNSKEVIYDGDGKKVPDTSYFGLALNGDTPMSALNDFTARLPQAVRVAPCDNGDYLMFTEEEASYPKGLGLSKSSWYTHDLDGDGVESDSDGNYIDFKKAGLAKFTFAELSAYIHKSMKSIGVPSKEELKKLSEKEAEYFGYVRKELPAVYNITSDALTTIVCPFFWFLSPFESVKFRSRYSLGGQVGYYADFTAQDQYFMMLWQSISFSTTGKDNEVQMVCTVLNKEG